MKADQFCRTFRWLNQKRCLLPVLALALMGLVPAGVRAATDDYIFTFAGDEAVVARYTGPGGDVVIPGVVDGYPVAMIGGHAFEGTTPSSVTIPDSVVAIGNYAFYGCASLTRVTFGENLVSIGDGAFSRCSGLTEAVLPDALTSLGDQAFRNCTQLSSVSIPEGVTEIGMSAFRGCTSLNSVSIPDTVTGIGSYAFQGCSSLAAVTIPEGLTGIGASAFHGCTSLNSVSIPDAVTSIGSRAFSGCSGLEEINVGPGNARYSSIDGVLFDKERSTIIQYPGGIQGGFTIPDGTAAIGPNAFSGAKNLTDIHIPGSVTSIGNQAFYGCSGLTSVTLPDSITDIGYQTFYWCTGLISVTIPGSVTNIGIEAFGRCNALSSIIVPGSIRAIADRAFDACSALTEVLFEGDAPSHGSSVFASAPAVVFRRETAQGWPQAGESWAERPTALWQDQYEVTLLLQPSGSGAVEGGGTYSRNADVTVAAVAHEDAVFHNWTENGEVVSPEAIYGFKAIADRSLTANFIRDPAEIIVHADPEQGGSVSGGGIASAGSQVEISAAANPYWEFAAWNDGSTDNPRTITVPPGGATYTAVFVQQITEGESYTYTVDGGEVVILEYTGAGGDVSIPAVIDGLPVSTIGIGAFAGRGVTSVTIPDSITRLEMAAFYGCADLENVVFGGGVQIIGDYAFENCSSLETVSLPDNIISIGRGAFRACINLTDVLIGNGVTTIGRSAFEYCANLSNVVIGNNVNAIGDHAFFKCTSLMEIIIPDSVINIGDYAFLECSSLQSLHLGNGVTYIGSFAFCRCSSLESVVIGDGVTSIGDGAFSDCTGLTEMTIGENVAAIGWGAFAGCAQLTSLNIPASVADIGNGAFNGCTGLESIVVDPQNSAYSSVGGVLFDKGRTRLIRYPEGKETGDYIIPEEVTQLDENAFFRCANLTGIVLGSNVGDIGERAFTGCNSLEWIAVNPQNSAYSSVDGVLFDADRTRLIRYPTGKTGDYTIPAGTTRIESHAFYACTGLASVTVPDSVTFIDSYAFSHCDNLTAVVVGSNVASVGDYLFTRCADLVGVYFKGNAPSATSYGSLYTDYSGTLRWNPRLFSDDSSAIVYFLEGTARWGPHYGGCPTALWLDSGFVVLNVAADPGHGGAVTGGGTYSLGETAEITAEPAPGWVFTGWGDGNNDNPRTIAELTAGASYYAQFISQDAEVTVLALPIAGGTVGGGGTFTPGSEVTVTSSANDGYDFTGWTEGGEHLSAEPVFAFTVTEDRELIANFAIIHYALNYTAGDNGAISGVASQSVEHGADGIAVVAVPDEGYHFLEWSDGSIENPRTDSAVTANLAVTAHFALSAGGYSGGTGAENDPFLIASVGDWLELLDMDADWDKHFKVIADLDFDGVAITPVGNSQQPFTGTMSGGGHVLRNIILDLPDHDSVGIFGRVGEYGILRDLGVENAEISGQSYVGGLAGWLAGTVTNCFLSGTVTGLHAVGGLAGEGDSCAVIDSHTAGTVHGNSMVGGVAGYIGGRNKGVVSRCTSSADVFGSSGAGGLIGESDEVMITDSHTSGAVHGGSPVGGLVGYLAWGPVLDSSASGPVEGTSYVGGLVGMQDGLIARCFATGAVTGEGRGIGGLVGEQLTDAILDSYATGAVQGGSRVGGLVGDSYGIHVIQNSYSTGSVNGEEHVGGLVAEPSPAIASYWNIETSGQAESAGGEGRSTAEMTHPHAANTYAGWDFDEVWVADTDGVNDGYPLLQWQVAADDDGEEPEDGIPEWMKPDFVITAVILDPVPETPNAGFSARVTVLNQGDIAGDAGVLRVWLGKATTALVGEPGDAELPAGEIQADGSVDFVFEGLTAPGEEGWYQFRAFIDADNVTDEKSEGNNQKSMTYSLAAEDSPEEPSWKKPDFIISEIYFVDVESPAPGEPFRLRVRIENKGDIAGDGGYVHFWPASPYDAHTAVISIPVGELEPGQSITRSRVLTAPVEPGTYLARGLVVADTPEKSAGNNAKTITYTMHAEDADDEPSWMKPDFIITELVMDPVPSVTGAEFEARVTVKNKGDVAGEAGVLRAWRSKPSNAEAGEPGDAELAVGVLDVGQSRVLVFAGLTAANDPGWHHFRVYVDADNITDEKSGGNNQKSKVYRALDVQLVVEHHPEGMKLQWNSRWGLTYRVMRSTNLAGGFEPIATLVEATPPVNTFIDTNPPNAYTLFYAIEIE